MLRTNPPSIRLLAALVVVVPVVVVSAALLALVIHTTRHISDDLADAAVREISDRVAVQTRGFLDEAVRVSDLYARRVRQGSLPVEGDLTAWERPMIDDLLTSPDVKSICFGNARGDATWALFGRGGPQVGRVEGGAGGEAVELPFDAATGKIGHTPIRTYLYDPRGRPWYKAAEQSDGPRWTDIYFWYGTRGADSVTGAGYTRAIRDDAGGVRGVLVIDVTLRGLSDFLATLPRSERGCVFVVDDRGLLVAASHGHVTSDDGHRLSPRDSESPLVREASAALAATGGIAPRASRLEIDGAASRVSVTPLEPYPGLRWRIATVIPESVFMAEANAARKRGATLALAAVALGLVLGVWFSGRLSRPLLELAAFVRRVGGGDFDSRLDLRATRELRDLSGELNRMAGGLRERVKLEQGLAVARAVQQSLLPARDPAHPRYDVAGRASYCDATGGDYFDFIDLAHGPEGGLLIALGDVTGHGIGAALLMASARAALRSHAREPIDTGRLLTRVNEVLAKDARHQKFMTMVALELDPQKREARWASAGQDAPILFDPAADAFSELDGGDLPLGVAEGVVYEEYRRGGLATGAVILIGTDGIWEAEDSAGAYYGKDRLREVIRASHAGTAADIAAAIEKDLAAHRGEKATRDDVTFVVVKVKP